MERMVGEGQGGVVWRGRGGVVDMCMCACVDVCMYVYVYVCMCMYMCVCVCIFTRTHIVGEQARWVLCVAYGDGTGCRLPECE